ncbi:MAG: hypothetical protein KC503_05645 [Myxococcales bacterium]|nr:hypothetical protein [Myxococcales bacterium]
MTSKHLIAALLAAALALALAACGDSDGSADGPALTPDADAAIDASADGAGDDTGGDDLASDSAGDALALDSTRDGPALDGSHDVQMRDATAEAIRDGPSADSTTDGPAGDSTIDGPAPDVTVDALIADATVDSISSDTTVDSISPDTTVDSLSPDATVDQGGSSFDLNGPDGLLGQTVPSPTPAANPSDPWDASTNQPDGHNATLATAWPTGVVTPSTNNPYIQIVLDSRGVAFFVFQAGAGLTSFNVSLNHSLTAPPQWATLSWAHLHGVTNSQFGAPIAPTTYTYTSQLITAAWPVTAGNTYVLELVATGSGFV